jgi:hypothetical protein
VYAEPKLGFDSLIWRDMISVDPMNGQVETGGQSFSVSENNVEVESELRGLHYNQTREYKF